MDGEVDKSRMMDGRWLKDVVEWMDKGMDGWMIGWTVGWMMVMTGWMDG